MVSTYEAVLPAVDMAVPGLQTWVLLTSSRTRGMVAKPAGTVPRRSSFVYRTTVDSLGMVPFAPQATGMVLFSCSHRPGSEPATSCMALGGEQMLYSCADETLQTEGGSIH